MIKIIYSMFYSRFYSLALKIDSDDENHYLTTAIYFAFFQILLLGSIWFLCKYLGYYEEGDLELGLFGSVLVGGGIMSANVWICNGGRGEKFYKIGRNILNTKFKRLKMDVVLIGLVVFFYFSLWLLS